MPRLPTPSGPSSLPQPVAESLARAGLIVPGHFSATALTGGISSDIFAVHSPDRPSFVVKQALARLRVRDDWRADTSRNQVEARWLRHVTGIMPENVPAVLLSDDHAGYFAMEYLAGLRPWKSDLLAGKISEQVFRQAGHVLGWLHARTWQDARTGQQFATDHLFRALRVEPYLLATGRRHPALGRLYEAEAGRLMSTKTALVHGDYSPKNLLIGADRFVMVDAEVGWYGDPAFDVAFLLTHLHLKALHHHPALPSESWRDAARLFVAEYSAALQERWNRDLEHRILRLLLMLLLARIDGQSPVEYLEDERRKILVRGFVHHHLPRPPASLADLGTAWVQTLKSSCA